MYSFGCNKSEETSLQRTKNSPNEVPINSDEDFYPALFLLERRHVQPVDLLPGLQLKIKYIEAPFQDVHIINSLMVILLITNRKLRHPERN